MLALQSEAMGVVERREGGCLTHAGTKRKEESYRPTSKAGEARGESSVVIVKMPSNFLSG